jgi:hypothetical protein
MHPTGICSRDDCFDQEPIIGLEVMEAVQTELNQT